jgi:Na+/H+ antiporter NhaD/arsenite permease-like protein
MLCGLLGGLSYRDHLALMAPVAAVGLAVNHAVLWLVFRRQLAEGTLDAAERGEPMSERAKVTLAVIAGSAVAYTLGGHLAWTAVAGFVMLMLLHRRDTRQLWPRIDWTLLCPIRVSAGSFSRWPPRLPVT